MEKYKIITLPNPILRKKAKKVEKIDESIKTIIKNMICALDMSEIAGLAIAAPQIGESIRVIVVRVNEAKDNDGNIIQKEIPLTVYINPTIIKYSKEKVVSEEGCLSYPYYYGPVERAKKVRFEAMNNKGKNVKTNASGLFARIVQHEVDHLDGILFIDKVTDKSKLRKVEKTAKKDSSKKGLKDGEE